MHIPIKIIWQIITTYRYRVTLRLVLNLTQIGLAMMFSRTFGKAIVWGKPALLMVEPTNFCNLKCPMCPSGSGELTRPRGRMDVEAYRKVIDEVRDTLILIQFWNQGEPFLHPEFLDMIRYAKAKGIPTMTSTNGHFLDSVSRVDALIESGLDEIIISLDGLNQESYETYRVGGQFQKVVDGICLLAKRKKELGSKTPIIDLQFLVLKHNEAQVAEIRELAKKLGANVLQLKSAQVYSEEQAETFLPDDDAFRRYDFDGKAHRMKSRIPNWCKFLWYGAVLNQDGSLAPCCFDKDGRFNYGNPFKEGSDVQSIWKNPRSREFRNRILHARDQLDICQNCFEGMKQDFTKYIPIVQEKRTT